MAIFRSNTILALTLVGLACSPHSAQEPAAAIIRDRIEHIAPKPESVGPMPARFEWTAVAGVDEYQITIENEVDMLMAEARVRGTTLDFPKDKKLDNGTYFWRVEGLAADGRSVADSGRAAFVVTGN